MNEFIDDETTSTFRFSKKKSDTRKQWLWILQNVSNLNIAAD